ncbi:sigma-70 family RNA polymerase sigma factor [Fodinicola acaciae]|uniref:sigma-70 family RNA polymerase sigma factor n=1 Tax=Fodinicola acaciae TaxID=2681555 RepID=UPI001C9E4F3F|nr:sigma-70 family RNA polymerase sigma factor [Fodinicola acaciae]
MRADDEQAYVDYVTSALPALRRLALLLCRDPHRAEDVVQTAITRLYVHWHRAKAAGNLDGYARTTLVRSFLNEQRMTWARVRLVGAPVETPNLPAAQPPDVETRTVVHTALSRVAPKQRAVLVLRFLYDLPVAEVARVLGCSEGNVTSQTAQGLKRLRKLLGDTAVSALGGR